MAKHMLEDPNDNYMEFKDITLKKPLKSVKRTEKKNDTLVIPDNLLPIISRFFEAEDVEYKIIENPALYPADKLKAGLKAYEDCSPTFKMAVTICLNRKRKGERNEIRRNCRNPYTVT